MGAYRESAAQYERALRFPTDDLAVLAELHDGYADQLAMLDSWPRAAAAREQARDLWRVLGDSRREAYASRRLASIYWRQCRGPESTAAIERALELLEPGGPDPELARTLATHAFDVWARDADAGRETLAARWRWPTRSVTQRCAAMSSTTPRSAPSSNAPTGYPWRGTACVSPWRPGAEAQAGRAYANIYTWFSEQYRFAQGERYWRDGIAYCDERDIATYATCLRGHRAMALLDLGRWEEAEEIADRVLATEASPTNLLTSQVTKAGSWPGVDCPEHSTYWTPGRRGRQPR